ncbi:MAG: carbohydrate kinase family protein, partial [Firmicutes bacterium]|nr:carbohydrate kinase family protein [Bacillota bacterium]
TRVNSLKVPKEMIAGSVGAGDAFCAGCLYAISKGYSDEEMLAYASAAAACNLFSENSVDGMKTADQIWEMARNWERIK